MTHDELMSALNTGITVTGNRLATHEEDSLLYRKALLAVVELHKPLIGLPYEKNFRCNACNYNPCPTIQAIQSALE